MPSLISLVELDKVRNPILGRDIPQVSYIIGFISALLKLIIGYCSNARFPEELSKFSISETASENQIALEITSLSSIQAEVDSLTNLRRRPVIFLDEFCPKTNDAENEKSLAYIRRQSINSDLPVIVASTNSSVANMLYPNGATEDSRGSTNPWVRVVGHLPDFVFQEATIPEKHHLNQLNIKKNIWITSRPLFCLELQSKPIYKTYFGPQTKTFQLERRVRILLSMPRTSIGTPAKI